MLHISFLGLVVLFAAACWIDAQIQHGRVTRDVIAKRRDGEEDFVAKLVERHRKY